ncbi:unnamed protein product [Timema podura]|uniref:Malate dehydrogenase, mitochondrial n=1 Tax=Timema podura TaxID=61482 RepID=A0ABN7P7A8_TIMPD|nr:unnamed protein product [Timema podura]
MKLVKYHCRQGADIILLCAGAEEKAGESQDDFFHNNAAMGLKVVKSYAKNSPDAMLVVATQPTDVLMPMMSELLSQNTAHDRNDDVLWQVDKFNPRKVFGMTAHHVIKANTHVGEVACIDPSEIIVPVIGGNSTETIVPLLSQAKPCSCIELNESAVPQLYHARFVAFQEERRNITYRIKHAEEWVRSLRKHKGSDFLSCALALVRFTISLIKGIHGEEAVIECAFVKTEKIPGLSFFALPLLFGPEGLRKSILKGEGIVSTTKDTPLPPSFCRMVDEPPKAKC